jgi:hypothetical protein
MTAVPPNMFEQRKYPNAAKPLLSRRPKPFINNKWVLSGSNATITVEGPSSGEKICRNVDASGKDVDLVVSNTRAAFGADFGPGLGSKRGRCGMESHPEAKTDTILH